MGEQGTKQIMNIIVIVIMSFIVFLLLLWIMAPSSGNIADPRQAFTSLIDGLGLSSQRNYIEQGYTLSKGYYLVQLLAEKSQCDTNTDELYWYNKYCESMCDDKPCLCLVTADGLDSFKDSNSELSAMFPAYKTTKDSRGYENLLLSDASDPEATLRTFTNDFTSKFKSYFGGKEPVAYYCSPVKVGDKNAIILVDYDYTFLILTQCVKLSRILSGPLSGNELSITAENSQKSC